KLNYGMSAVGSLGHLTVEMLKKQEGLELVNVPFRGGAQVMNELAAGRVDIASDSFTVMLPHVQAGKFKLLGTLGEQRVPGFDFPTVAESIPGMSAESGTGLVVPAGTPDFVVQKISADVAKVLARPAVKKRLEELGIEVIGSTPREFEDYLRAVSTK